MSYLLPPEIVLSGLPDTEIDVPELTVTYTRSTSRIFDGKITQATDVAEFIRTTFGKDEIELQEQVIVLYLNQANNIIGYYRHSKGAINATVADIRIIIGAALKCAAVAMVIAHNHPSGNLKPSPADQTLTEKLKEGCKIVDITLLDHIIITKNGYYSFGEDGLLGLAGLASLSIRKQSTASHDKEGYVAQMCADLSNHVKHNKISTEKLAASFGISSKTEVKEFTELAIVISARKLAHAPGITSLERFNSIVELYNTQANLSHRTSNSVLLQQYSTPAPIAYLAGLFAGLADLTGYEQGFEPSAGNGLLTIAGDPGRIIVNEIDQLRKSNLEGQEYAEVLHQDASQPFTEYNGHIGHFKSVITNPPFGTVDVKVDYDGFPINSLEMVMSLRALDTMHHQGRAAIIIGGHTTWDSQGRIQAGKNRIFFNYLYSHYHVQDVINIDGHKLYSRQGTAFNVRLILIAGRKSKVEGVAPLKDKSHSDYTVSDFDTLYRRVSRNIESARDLEYTYSAAYMENKHKGIDTGRNTTSTNEINKTSNTVMVLRALALELEMDMEQEIGVDVLGMAYEPASVIGKSLQTQVPDSMAFETQQAISHIQKEVGGDVDNFVRDRLGYTTKTELGEALSAEQIDAMAMAIYNVEGRKQGMIIGDQTGIGKGRIAAAMIRYACKRGIVPIFLTEKPNLFSDIYRDLKAIGSAELVPFIVNGKEGKTDIKDEEGTVIHSALSASEQDTIFKSLKLPAGIDFVLATYTQFNSPLTKPLKPQFLSSIASGSIMIMDEAHNSSGASNVGAFLKDVVKSTDGVMFLSATFAKRPDNMPIYAMKTCMSDCALDDESLVNAIEKGGVALQEVISSQLVSEGQMLRRERSYEGIEVNYLTMEDMAQEHRAAADMITAVIRRIIAFQIDYVDEVVKVMDGVAAAEGKEVGERKGTKSAGVDSTPYFSKVFNIINQMLFAIKADAVADRAIMRLREGKKPVIAFSSTMGAFLETMGTDGEVIKADFAEVLARGLTGVMKVTERSVNGVPIYKSISVNDLSPEGVEEYLSIHKDISRAATGLCISPIDILIEKIKAAGYSVAEVTGRKIALKLASPNEGYSLNGAALNETATQELLVDKSIKQSRKDITGMIYARKKENTNDAFRRFNNNEVDVLLINQSGSTGASAHAVPTSKVPATEVKQRVMIVLQAELDINTEVQKRGRVNRTGQILKPIYDYLISAIPAEQRLMMMLQKKLKSLDANTASNQKQSSTMLDVPDFLNKYGDKVTKAYLLDNPEVNKLLDDPLKLEGNEEDGDKETIENAAQKVSGRVAVLSTEMQSSFYDDIASRYTDLVSYLKQAGEYDLELEAMNLQAETTKTSVISVGTGGGSPFGENVVLETVMANVLRKPYTGAELVNILHESLSGGKPKEIQSALISEFQTQQNAKLETELTAINLKYDAMLEGVVSLKKIKKIEDDEERHQAIEDQKDVIRESAETAKDKAENHSRNVGYQLSQFFKFFHIGRICSYPIAVMGQGMEKVPTVFLGYVIDRRKANPFAPSAVKLRFAIANGIKYMELPASMYKEISPIISSSMDTYQGGSDDDLIRAWDSRTSEGQAARKKRYIVTGNLLQALGSHQGRLINYTLMAGGETKGLLMPESWDPNDIKAGNDKVTVPISKATGIIKSLQPGNNIKCSNGLIIAKDYQGRYKMYVPASKQAGGDIYLDQELQKWVSAQIWEKQSDKMVALVDQSDIEDFLATLATKHPCTVPVPKYNMAQIDTGVEKSGKRHYHIVPPSPAPKEPTVQTKDHLKSISLLALALELEMEMEMELAA